MLKEPKRIIAEEPLMQEYPVRTQNYSNNRFKKQNSNSEIKNTQSQLKDVEKLLKLDPGNTELLAQKQKLLSSAVSETKEKLATLKTAAEQANQAQ